MCNQLIDVSDVISILSIVVNAFIAIWVVSEIQKNTSNRRILKDHFINEVKDIKDLYKDKFNQIMTNKSKPKDLLIWFKVMYIKIDDLLKCLNELYDVDLAYLEPYQRDLRYIVTENSDFIDAFSSNSEIQVSTVFMRDLMDFHQKNHKIFNKLIIQINNN